MDIERTRLDLPNGQLRLPAFLPDATHGVVRATDAADMRACGIQALVMNVFHLMQKPGSTTIKALGGLHAMSGWDGPIMTDSGGFQAYSLIRENAKYGSLTDKGLIFRPDGARDRILLTPEKSIQLQMQFGADIVVCLDDCTHADDPYEVQRKSVDRTVAWAKRCKDEFERRLDKHQEGLRPLLFGVVQGGGDLALRQECAEKLLEIGFDGYGLGGWPLDGEGKLLTEVIAFLRRIIPAEYPMHALGVGHPNHIVSLCRMGYELFDCTLPTRDARQGRLYTYNSALEGIDPDAERWFSFIYIKDDVHKRDGRPLDPSCDCPVCQRYSRGFLHHLYDIGDVAYQRLATIHNLRFMTRLTEYMRTEGRTCG